MITSSLFIVLEFLATGVIISKEHNSNKSAFLSVFEICVIKYLKVIKVHFKFRCIKAEWKWGPAFLLLSEEQAK